MDAEGGFVVEIKQSAIERNPWAALLRDREGSLVEFDSEMDAKETATKLSNYGEGVNVRIQRAAGQDSTETDAYLVALPETRKRNPDGSLDEGWTFDTTANQYGAIGETLVTAGGTPALRHYVMQDLPSFPSERVRNAIRIHVESEPRRMDTATIESAAAESTGEWVPDCEVRVSFGDPEKWIHRYFCEIKTGNASFQRTQQDAMDAVAKQTDVLKLRVTIDDLPTEYSIAVRRVGDEKPVVDWESQRRRLEETQGTLDGPNHGKTRRKTRLTDFE